jgi:hypothetical protein
MVLMVKATFVYSSVLLFLYFNLTICYIILGEKKQFRRIVIKIVKTQDYK